MGRSWSRQDLRKYREIKCTNLFIYLLIFTSIIFGSYYHFTIRYAFQGAISKQDNNNKSIFSIPNGFNSCPKQFRTRQPPFPWPSRAACDIECAVSELHAVLPTVAWFDENYKRFSNFNIGSRPEKWFNLDYELGRTAYRLPVIKLFPPTKQEFLLDIGTGFGYFPLFASHFNHCVIATNRYEPKLNREMQLFRNATTILGLDVRPYQIIPMTAMPINLFDGIKFDVVTAYVGWFHCQPRMWELSEWIFFLADIADHHTTKNARAYFDLNRCNNDKGKIIGSIWSSKTMSILERKGVQFINKHQGPTQMKIMNLKAFRS